MTFKNSLLKKITTLCLSLFFFHVSIIAQEANKDTLPVKMGELTAPDFIKAVEASGTTAIIPLGILEKHGPHLPIATDLIIAREIALRAANLEYTIVFPEYYFGQIFEAKQQPGTIAYSADLMMQLLQETCDELARNGVKKIILVNGHGGNNSFIPFFCQQLLEKERDYVVVLFRPSKDEETKKEIEKLLDESKDGHAGEGETSMVFAARKELVHPERGGEQSGEKLDRIKELENAYTAIWWYASFPNHYSGDGSNPNEELGNILIDSSAKQLAKLVKQLKSYDKIKELQDMFYKDSKDPLQTKQ